MTENVLYYGDNLDVMRRYIDAESVDLVYLDPPFNSNATYNVLFAEKSGDQAAAQIKAFEDTWHWDQSSEAAYWDVLHRGGRVADALKAMRDLLGENDMMAYLAMMAPRLIELHRVLKPTGSIYLHCDPTASHYLKMLMDSIFSPRNFRNEIVWERTAAKGNVSRRLPRDHDIILSYQMSDDATWNEQAVFTSYDHDDLDAKTDEKYSLVDETGRRYQLTSLISPNPNRPNLIYEFMGMTKVWRWTKDRMLAAYEAGVIVQPRPGAVPRFKRYLDQQRGKPLADVWTDIAPLNSQARERLGYPTQKPVALLERIIELSSKPGDLVLDPFCGCGTTIDAAQRLERSWTGIDITYLAISLIKSRLLDSYGDSAAYRVIGEPTALTDAQELARDDPYQFQWWALGLVDARPVEQKKGADRGIDGRLYFQDDAAGHTKQAIFSVKAGHVTVSYVRDLVGVLDREKAAIGVLISMEEPTQPMKTEAASAGFYEWAWTGWKFPRVQLLTVAELLDGRRVDMPPIRQVSTTFKRAPSRTKTVAQQGTLLRVAEEPAEYEPAPDFDEMPFEVEEGD